MTETTDVTEVSRRLAAAHLVDNSEGMSYLNSGPRKLLTTYLPLTLILIFLLFPFYWMVLTAIKPNNQLIDMKDFNPFFVTSPTLDHIKQLLFDLQYPRWLWNTMYVAVASTFISLVASVMAAYAIVRLRYRGAQWVGGLIFLAYLVPPSILFIPLATIIQEYGLFNSPLSLVLVYPTILIPFSTWLLMGYFKTIPYELEECALIDGASRLQILTKIILPLAVPGLISAGNLLAHPVLERIHLRPDLHFLDEQQDGARRPGQQFRRRRRLSLGHADGRGAGGFAAAHHPLFLLRRILRLGHDRRREGMTGPRRALIPLQFRVSRSTQSRSIDASRSN